MADGHQLRSESTSGQSKTSYELLAQVRNNDEAAWNRLVEIYTPLVYRLCRVAGVQANDAADVIQEVFLAVARNLESFRYDRPQDSFRGWLLAITKNKIHDHFRIASTQVTAEGGSDFNARVQQLQDMDWDSSTDGLVFNSQAVLIERVVRLVRDDFEEKTWQAFWRVTVEGQAADAVAQQLHISKWSVYQSKSRILRRIRAELNALS